MEKLPRRKTSHQGFKILLYLSILLLSTTYLVHANSFQQTAKEGQAIYVQRCIACHTIGGGDLVGPDLQGVTDRRETDWLVRFISAPDKMIAEGDPIAIQLLEEFNNVAMPNMALSDIEVEAILAFLESGITTDQVSIPLPAGSAQQGSDLFLGGRSFQNGGVPCMGCHSVGGVGAFGGGNLGPDLTHVFQRFGETGLASSLQNISFPTMQGVYVGKSLSDQEVADLVAFFEQADASEQAGAGERFTGLFWTGGIVGVIVLFGAMALFWPRQRESLSDRLRKTA